MFEGSNDEKNKNISTWSCYLFKTKILYFLYPKLPHESFRVAFLLIITFSKLPHFISLRKTNYRYNEEFDYSDESTFK